MKKIPFLIISILFMIITQSCENTSKETEQLSTYYNLQISVNCIQNLIFSKYNVDIYIDDEKKTTITHGDTATYDFKVEEGTHILKFTKEGYKSIKGEITIDEIQSDIEASFKINCESDGITVKKDFIDRLIEPGDDEIKLKTNLSELYSINYKNAVDELTKMGFKKIKTLPQNDLIIGLFSNEFDVASISINGRTEFFRGDIFNKNADIIVRYHTYENEVSIETTTSKIVSHDSATTNNNNESTAQIVETKVNEATDITNDSIPEMSNTQSVINVHDPSVILTTDNCIEFADLFTSSTGDSDFKLFANKYKDRTIFFNGSIDYFANHDNYKTKFDILLSYGDYSEESQVGPTFVVRNVSAHDLGFDTLYLDNAIHIGENVRIAAIIDRFDENSTLFYLRSLSIAER